MMTTDAQMLDTTMAVAPLHGVTRWDDWGVIAAEGDDAAAFLHGQLTQDILLQRPEEARLVAYCTPKGRMLLTGIAIKNEKQILLCAPRERIAPTLKRLSLFVLRAKVRLADVGQQWALWGLAGNAVPAQLPDDWWAVVRADDRCWIRLPPGAGVSRALLLQRADAPAPVGDPMPGAHWRWLEVMSGVAHVTDPVVEAFVPQMLNYESVGGVNFKKGCYPGQEVVARSQFRGTIKRRAYLVHAEGAVAAGQEIFHPSDREQPVGLVAQAAPHPVAGWDAIISLQTSAADGQPLTAGSPEGTPLHLQPLPYPLRQDI